MDTTTKLAVVAGLRALSDSGVELYKDGQLVGLPESMRSETGTFVND